MPRIISKPPPAVLGRLAALAPSVQLGSHTAQVLYGGENYARCRDIRPHVHSFYEVCHVGRGRGVVMMDDADYDVGEGQMFIARPTVVHQIKSAARDRMGIDFWAFTLSADPSRPADPVDDLVVAFTYATRPAVTASPTIAAAIGMLRGELTSATLGCQSIVRALTEVLLIDTLRHFIEAPLAAPPMPADPVASARVSLAQRFMADNLHRPISAVDVAQQMHLSPRHARRLFQQLAGKSIQDWLTAKRIERAERLLREQRDWPIKRIAVEVGYGDVSAFSHRFRRHTGCSPAHYRSRSR